MGVERYILTRQVASRALSLRNLVSGYECGRVFQAGVGPGLIAVHSRYGYIINSFMLTNRGPG